MCKRTVGFTGSMKVLGTMVEFAIIDQLDDRRFGDAADEFLIGMDDGYETVELSQDAMDEGRCDLLADMDGLHTSEDAPTAVWRDSAPDTLDPVRYEAAEAADHIWDTGDDGSMEDVVESLLSDAKDTGWEYAQQDVTLVGGRSMWAMRHAGQTIGW